MWLIGITGAAVLDAPELVSYWFVLSILSRITVSFFVADEGMLSI